MAGMPFSVSLLQRTCILCILMEKYSLLCVKSCDVVVLRVSFRSQHIEMPMVDPFQATTREELLYLCQLALQDHPPLLKRNFVEVSQTLSGSQERKIRFMTWNTLADGMLWAVKGLFIVTQLKFNTHSVKVFSQSLYEFYQRN